MEIIELRDIDRKDSPIHYINEYHATLVYDNNGSRNSCLIEIIIEKTAFSTVNIRFSIKPEQEADLKDYKCEIESFLLSKQKGGYFPE